MAKLQETRVEILSAASAAALQTAVNAFLATVSTHELVDIKWQAIQTGAITFDDAGAIVEDSIAEMHMAMVIYLTG